MIKVGYCVAYDWNLLQYSIPQVYKQADVICLSIDQHRRSWAGKRFSWDEQAFRAMVEQLDVNQKIKIYEDDFYNPAQTPMENEVAQRNKIAAYLGEGGWHIQLDADEYFLDFSELVSYLHRFKSNRKVNINCPMVNLYKLLPEGILWIKPEEFQRVEYFPIATKYPLYEYGRRNSYFNVLTGIPILHQSWARSETEIWEKLNNWGHAQDFDVLKYYNLWKEANALNFEKYKNFHHLHPATWPALELQVKVKAFQDVTNIKKEDFPLPISKKNLFYANSLWLSRSRKILSVIKKKSK